MEAIQREQHAAYMRELRQSRDYKDSENKLRVLGRIREGSMPHVYSLTKYNITRDDINDLRRRDNIFEPKKGEAIVFPANWCFLHQGNPVTKG